MQWCTYLDLKFSRRDLMQECIQQKNKSPFYWVMLILEEIFFSLCFREILNFCCCALCGSWCWYFNATSAYSKPLYVNRIRIDSLMFVFCLTSPDVIVEILPLKVNKYSLKECIINPYKGSLHFWEIYILHMLWIT